MRIINCPAALPLQVGRILLLGAPLTNRMQRVLLLSLLGVVSVSGCGCYWSTSVHACDCTIAETDCVGGGGSGGIWTTGCSSCACTAVTTAPSVAAPSSPPVVDDHGCYDVTDTHQCDCNIVQSACTPRSVGIWTSGCGCDNTGETNTVNLDDHGCYNVGDAHQCDCYTYVEATCTTAGGSWISGCGCAEEALPPPSPARPPPPVAGVVHLAVQAQVLSAPQSHCRRTPLRPGNPPRHQTLYTQQAWPRCQLRPALLCVAVRSARFPRTTALSWRQIQSPGWPRPST